MKILITGVCGYIGGKIAERLLGSSHLVIGIDIKPTVPQALFTHSNFRFHQADVTSAELNRSLEPVEILIHCSAVKPGTRNLSKEDYFRVNLDGTIKVLSGLSREALRHVVFLSTVSACREASADPTDFYSASKAMAEESLSRYANASGISRTILRLAPVYGADSLTNLEKRIYLPGKMCFYRFSSGEQRVSLCSVNNVVDVVASVLDPPGRHDGVFIVKDACDYSINEIIGLIRKRFRRRLTPLVPVPSALPAVVLHTLHAARAKTFHSCRRQLAKVAQECVYSGPTVEAGQKWDLRRTLAQATSLGR